MNCNYSNKYKCKNKILLEINGKRVCSLHFNMHYKKYLILIQRVYKGYIVRKKLNTLFYNLPRDIQTIVIYYINLPVYYNLYYKKIQTIVCNKTKFLFNKNKKFDINSIIQSYYLFNKYNIIMDLNFLKYTYILAKEIVCQLNNDLYVLINNYNLYDIMDFYNNLNDNFVILNDDYNIANIINGVSLLNKYINIYENKYNLINLVY